LLPETSLTVVGSINLDLVTRVRRLPRPGETLSGATLEPVPGGKGANQAVAAARLGSRVRITEASKIYLIGQLGKYLPGSVWAFFAQMELARKAGVPRSRSFTASIVAVCINLVTGLAVGTLVIPSVAHGDAWRYVAIVALFFVLIAGLSPPVLTRLIDLLMRVVKRPRLERSISWKGMLAGSAWSLGSWVAYGLSLWVLAVGAGAPVGSRGEVPGDPAEMLYRLGLRQADPASGIRDYRAARATFTELLSQYPHSRRDAEARAWQAATLTDLLVREDDARRALLRLQRSEEDKKRTRANLEWLRQNDLDLERRK